MTTKLTQIATHWDADDAYTVIAFLDELRDVLWAAYGDDIIQRQQALQQGYADLDNPSLEGLDVDNQISLF